MDKIVVGPSSRGVVDLDAPVKDNLKNIARRLGRDVEDLTVIVLDRTRHQKLIADVREAGARIRLIGDGDLSAGISAAVAGTNIHALVGIGGAPEGVITAAAMKCLNGEIQARLVFDPELLGVDRKRCRRRRRCWSVWRPWALRMRARFTTQTIWRPAGKSFSRQLESPMARC